MYRALPPASSLPALHLGADNSPGAGVAPALHYSWPQGPKPSGVTHMEKQPTHSRLTVTSSAGTWGCLWLQQPVAAGLTGLQAAPFPPWHLQRLSLPHHSVFLGGTGCLCSPAQCPCIPSLSRTQARDTSFILTPSPNLRAGRHSFARNESETVQRTNSLPP